MDLILIDRETVFKYVLAGSAATELAAESGISMEAMQARVDELLSSPEEVALINEKVNALAYASFDIDQLMEGLVDEG